MTEGLQFWRGAPKQDTPKLLSDSFPANTVTAVKRQQTAMAASFPSWLPLLWDSRGFGFASLKTWSGLRKPSQNGKKPRVSRGSSPGVWFFFFDTDGCGQSLPGGN